MYKLNNTSFKRNHLKVNQYFNNFFDNSICAIIFIIESKTIFCNKTFNEYTKQFKINNNNLILFIYKYFT